MKLIGDLAADLMGEVSDALRPLYVLFFCETQSFFLQSSADVESSIIRTDAIVPASTDALGSANPFSRVLQTQTSVISLRM